MRGGDTLYICVAASYFIFMEVMKMNAKKCDRCGKYYVSNVRRQKYLIGTPGLGQLNCFDVCDDCYDLLAKFWNDELTINDKENTNHAEEG